MLSVVNMLLKREVGGLEITSLIMENHGKIMELCLNSCGNPVISIRCQKVCLKANWSFRAEKFS